ncbi:MAG: hypothetical protein QOH97_1303 [Actinoplanes sp.]|jgi:hypothetical protein|nr:hypothetical protein [Actinoplanes sp.]
MTEQRYGFAYHLNTVADPMQGKALPRSHGAVGGTQHNYVTIPWNDKEDGDDPANGVSLNYGWTFLFGPTVSALVFAQVRLMIMQERGSVHLRLYKVAVDAGVETRVWGSESPESFVGEGETHTAADGTVSYSSTHVDACWRVAALAPNERLRLEVDSWKAVNPDPDYEIGRIVGARVAGEYWRDGGTA